MLPDRLQTVLWTFTLSLIVVGLLDVGGLDAFRSILLAVGITVVVQLSELVILRTLAALRRTADKG